MSDKDMVEPRYVSPPFTDVSSEFGYISPKYAVLLKEELQPIGDVLTEMDEA